MKQVVIARTALTVSRLSFGTARLHHVPSRRARQRLLEHASAVGFSHFDTAPLYGAGLAEEELGRFLAARSQRVSVATKIGLYPPRGSRPRIGWIWARAALGRVWPRLSKPAVSWSLHVAERSLHQSLRRLRRDWVDILFLHEPDPQLVAAEETLRWLERQRSDGKVRYHGLAGDAPRFARWIAADHGLAHVLQVRGSLVHDHVEPALATRERQFTFGYLSSAGAAPDAAAVVRAALARSASGSVLVSSGEPRHIEQLGAAAREAPACT